MEASADKLRVIGYNILCDGGRLYRPLFNMVRIKEIAGALTGLPLRTALNTWLRGKTIDDVVSSGVVEMVFCAEFVHYTIAQRITEEDVFSHDYCELNPCAQFGIVGNCAPMLNHNPSGRAIHETAMAKSALTPGGTNMSRLSETSSKLLLTTERAATTTLYNEYCSRGYGNGTSATVMISLTNSNNEDAMTVSGSYARSVTTQRSHTFEVEVTQNIKVGIPPTVRNKRLYEAINSETGMPIVGANLKAGDCISPATSYNRSRRPPMNTKKRNQSTCRSSWMSGKRAP